MFFLFFVYGIVHRLFYCSIVAFDFYENLVRKEALIFQIEKAV